MILVRHVLGLLDFRTGMPVTRAGTFMSNSDLIVQVQPNRDERGEEVADLTQRLRTLLLDLDVDTVEPLTINTTLPGAKGPGAVIGWLAVQFSSAGVLKSVIAAVAEWVTRTGHDVEITYGKDSLKVTRVSSAQQQVIIDDFLARHAPRP